MQKKTQPFNGDYPIKPSGIKLFANSGLLKW